MKKIFFGLFVAFLFFSCMFAVLNTSKFHEVPTNKKAETKLQGRRPVESTAVLPRLRFGVSSSDRPFYFNLKLFKVMLDTKMDTRETTAQEKQVTADEIITWIISSDEIETHLDNLRDLMDHFFLHYKRPTKRYKQTVHYTYYILSDALKKIRTFKNQNQESL